VSYSHAYVSKILVKSHSACWNHTRACWNLIRACSNHTACRNYTLRLGIRLERVEITLVSVIFTRICVKLALVQRAACRNQSCACWFHTRAFRNYTLRVEITLCAYMMMTKWLKFELADMQLIFLLTFQRVLHENYSSYINYWSVS
jgi:hypothetical protein